MRGRDVTSMVKALIYKDATTRILRVVCLLAMCWVSLVYTVALMPISLDDSGTNPLTVESSTTLASQALVIIAAALAIIEINSGRNGDSGSPRRFPAANGVFLMTAKVVSIVVVGLMLTMVNAIGNFIAYGHGVSGRLMIRYMMLVVMNGVAVLSLSLLAGNVLLGLSIYFLVPILLKPFIVYLVPAVSDLFYSSAIRSLADGALPLQNSLVSLVWLLVFLLAGYLSIVVRILEW